jgi:hypothetical protein
MQLLAHQLAHIYNTSRKCYSYASRRENVHECHNCICIVIVLPSHGSKLEIHLPKGCPCLCGHLKGQEPGFLCTSLRLFTGNLMQVLMVHFFCVLLCSIGAVRRGPDLWEWAQGRSTQGGSKPAVAPGDVVQAAMVRAPRLALGRSLW